MGGCCVVRIKNNIQGMYEEEMECLNPSSDFFNFIIPILVLEKNRFDSECQIAIATHTVKQQLIFVNDIESIFPVFYNNLRSLERN